MKWMRLLFRAAFNPIIAEAHDASHGLYHARIGRHAGAGQVGSADFCRGDGISRCRRLSTKAAERWRPCKTGTSTFSTTRILGGTHLSDMRLVRPYYRDGKLFCYLASVGHWHDVGGAVPGNYNPAATDVFQEAFVLPPVKLARAGVINQDIIDILLRNTRLPQSAMGDLNGQLGALDLGVSSAWTNLLGEYGGDTVARRARRACRHRADALMRVRIARAAGRALGGRRISLTTTASPTNRLPITVALEIRGDHDDA